MSRLRTLTILLLLTACSRAPMNPNATEDAAMTTPPTSALSDFYGTWVYAEDPTGRSPFDPVYKGATLTLRQDRSYAFALGGGGSMGPMEGTWAVVKHDGDTLEHSVNFGEGRIIPSTRLVLRREGGQIVGLEQYEQPDLPQYFVRQGD